MAGVAAGEASAGAIGVGVALGEDVGAAEGAGRHHRGNFVGFIRRGDLHRVIWHNPGLGTGNHQNMHADDQRQFILLGNADQLIVGFADDVFIGGGGAGDLFG